MHVIRLRIDHCNSSIGKCQTLWTGPPVRQIQSRRGCTTRGGIITHQRRRRTLNPAYILLKTAIAVVLFLGQLLESRLDWPAWGNLIQSV